MSIHIVEQFSGIMNDEAKRQHSFEIHQEVRAMNRLAKQDGGVTKTSSLRRGEGAGSKGTGNKTVAPPYFYRDPGSDLIDTVVAINWRIREALNVFPESKELLDALQITTGLGMESAATVIKAIPHIRALIPDYTPERTWIMDALDRVQKYAEEEQECTTIGLGITQKV